MRNKKSLVVKKKARLSPKKKLKVAKKAAERGEPKKARKLAREALIEGGDDLLYIPKFLRALPIKGGPMSLIQFKVMGGKTVKRSFYQSFRSTDEAAKYFKEFANIRKYTLGAAGRVCTFAGSIDSIYSNMSIDDILAGKPIPKAGLPDIRPFDPLENVTSPAKREKTEATTPQQSENSRPSKRASSSKSNGNLVPLKRICQDLKMEPRAARMKLRKAVKQKDKYPALASDYEYHARWEWAEGSEALADAKRALS